MILILIPCSDHKTPGGEMRYDPTQSIVSSLPKSLGEQLLACRKELATLVGFPSGPDLGDEISNSVKYLPALERYKGNLYRAANIQLVDLKNVDAKQLLIVSALYGIVLPHELIRFYDVSMSTKLSSGIHVFTWWRRHKLGQLVSAVATSIDATETYDLLSNDYRQALAPWLASSNMPNYQRPKFGKVGQGINHYRGRALRRILIEE